MGLLALLLKTALVTACVYAVMAQTRRGRVELAGLVAVAVTAPSLGLLAVHHDGAFVADAAVGALLATPLCAFFAIACAALVRLGNGVPPRHRARSAPLWALSMTAVLTLILTALMRQLDVAMGPALAAAALAAWLAPWCIGLALGVALGNTHHATGPLPGPTASATPRAGAWGHWCMPLLAGLISASVSGAGAHLGPHLSGFLAGLPTIALCLTLAVGRQDRCKTLAPLLLAYSHGLRLRVLFAAVVALYGAALGAAWALALATALLLAAGCWAHGRVAARRAQVDSLWDRRFPRPEVGKSEPGPPARPGPPEPPADYSARAISSARFQSSSVSMSTTRQAGSS